MDQQLDESENLQWKAQITQTIPVTIGQTLSILPIGITATVGLSMLASGQVSILILLGYIIMAAKLSGAMGGVLLYLTEIFYLDARIARIGEIKNHELQGGEKAVLSDFNVEIRMFVFLPERHPGDSPCILYGGARTGNRIGRSQRLRKNNNA